MNKKWFHSKTLWANFIMFGGVLVMTIFGVDVVTPEMQASILAGVNVVLRLVTKEGLTL